jgi:tryptophan synthase alpha subunit
VVGSAMVRIVEKNAAGDLEGKLEEFTRSLRNALETAAR